MPNPSPVEGRCNAKRKDGLFCANRPVIPIDQGGNTRCRFHGGLNTGPRTKAGKERSAANGLRTGMYAKLLRSIIAKPEDRDIWDKVDRSTQLTQEIALWRYKILRFEKMLEEGTSTIVLSTRPDGTQEVQSVEDLISRGQRILTEMLKAQHDMHDGSEDQGRLEITIKLDSATEAAAQLDVPDLEANGVPEMPETTPLETQPHKGVTIRRKAHPIEDLDNE